MAFSHIVAIGSIAATSVTLNASSRPQSGAAAPRFEVVSVKPCLGEPQLRSAPGGGRGSRGVPVASPGRITLDCGTVERLINLAYIVNGERLLHNNATIAPETALGGPASPNTPIPWWKGGPSWMQSERFAVEATAPGVSDRAVLLGPMLRALLEDRFKLKLHREEIDGPLYSMVVAKGGFKGTSNPCSADPGAMPQSREEFDAWNKARWDGTLNECGIVSTLLGWALGGQTMDDVATKAMPLWHVDRFVVNNTGLDGKFNLRFSVHGADNVYAELERQLGLKLEPIRGKQEILVIDQIEKPGPDRETR